MADREPDGTATRPVSHEPPPMPRWVKYLILVLLAVVALAVLVMLLSGSQHGPGRHSANGFTGSASGGFTGSASGGFTALGHR